MNPIIIFYGFILAGLIWISLAYLFPKIGEFIINFIEDLNNIDEENDDEE